VAARRLGRAAGPANEEDAVIDAVRGYVQLASGLTQVTRQRALEAARQLLAATPAAEVSTAASVGAQALTGQVGALADELMATGRQNREQLRELIRTEAEAVLTRFGLTSNAELEAALSASRARVIELERKLADLEAAQGAKKSAAKKTAAKKTAAKKSATKKTAAKKSAAKKTAAKAPAEQAPAEQAPASQTAPPAPAGES
jgi:hypothetical protein